MNKFSFIGLLLGSGILGGGLGYGAGLYGMGGLVGTGLYNAAALRGLYGRAPFLPPAFGPGFFHARSPTTSRRVNRSNLN